MISAWDCLHFATLELVRSTPIKQRLIAAYGQFLSQIPDEQLPLEIREGYARILHSLHAAVARHVADDHDRLAGQVSAKVRR